MQNPNPLVDKEKAIIADGFFILAPLTDERCKIRDPQ